MPETQFIDSHTLEDLSDSDIEKHPAEALIIRKAEQASANTAADTRSAAEHAVSEVRHFPACKVLQSPASFPTLHALQEHLEHSAPAPKASKGPAVILAANPALAKARNTGKASAKGKGKKRSRDSRALDADPGEHSLGICNILCIDSSLRTGGSIALQTTLCRH